MLSVPRALTHHFVFLFLKKGLGPVSFIIYTPREFSLERK